MIFQSGTIVDFDILSIDIGSTPKIDNIQRAKPISLLLEKWQEVIQQTKQNSHKKINLSIIGGAGGIELALNMEYRLQQITSPLHLSNYKSTSSIDGKPDSQLTIKQQIT